MAEKILQKLDALDKEAAILLVRRAKENNLQRQVNKKSLVTPLTFDLQLEFEEAKTIEKITEHKFNGIKKPTRNIFFKPDLECRKNDSEKPNARPHSTSTNTKTQGRKIKESVEENLKSRSIRPFYYLKDTTEAENAKPLPDLYSQERQANRRALCSTIFSSVPPTQSNVYEEKDTAFSTAQTLKKTSELFDSVGHLEDYIHKRTKPPLQMNDFSTKETQSIRNDPLSQCSSARKKNVLPLCFEDELKKPNAKIIDATLAKTETSHSEQKDTNPIIFYESRYIQMLLLTKYRYPPYHMESRNKYTQKREDLTLDKNHKILKHLMNDQSIIAPQFTRTIPTAWRKSIQAVPWKQSHRVVEEDFKKEISKETLENIPWNKLYDFSQTFSSLTKKFVGFLDKTVIQEKSAKPGRFEKMISTVKQIHTGTFSGTRVKYHSKPIKNALEVHMSKNVTPLDALLKMSGEN
ncbi:uncharacterized protein C1orf141 homolog [Erinaceus europaeus]|uniref:Uncharacterized protein C1orf141 homolog n=1 Tax=Erinaceus europaeus TaxID=9365 RepID=A0ABM3YJ19_ERIEU|nr:uncharacterized protein C1orf141 homolog [Erinaceus europaeus]